MLSKLEDSKQFLLENRHLCCEETLNGLVLQCLDYEMEGVSETSNCIFQSVKLTAIVLNIYTEAQVDGIRRSANNFVSIHDRIVYRNLLKSAFSEFHYFLLHEVQVSFSKIDNINYSIFLQISISRQIVSGHVRRRSKQFQRPNSCESCCETSRS